jgi:hypothetical protein
MGCEDGTAPPSEPATAVAPFSDPALPGIERPDPDLTTRLSQELQNKGAKYGVRAEHRTADGSPKFVNRLISEQSPYLLQHAHNPVNWFAWGDEPFERARAEGKPVLLSIGYSTCHWCHVMERESFEDIEENSQHKRAIGAVAAVDVISRSTIKRCGLMWVPRDSTGQAGPHTMHSTRWRSRFDGR